MSTSIISSLAFAGKQVTVYGGILVFIAGILGDFFNIVIFVSLRTMRQNSCTIYLIIMSIVNIFQLCFNVLSRIMINVYGSDGTDRSLIYCKFRFFFSQFCTVFSLTCFCLATIDQYCATCSRVWLRQMANIKVARRLSVIFMSIWLLHGIPYFFFFNYSVSLTGKISCIATNYIYLQYRAYVVVLIFQGFLPITITVLFGSMSYYNVRQLAFYTVPLVRRELDKQLTAMVLVQVLINLFVLSPYSIANALTLNTNLNSDPIIQAQIQLANNITLILYYTHLAVSVT
ncbi:unnamed protein product [Adineta steineri]|uniref:G-protein coupled receptors family 1 profile domain-containing protein n=1 Tax=Adineta steineri TaxID=433720 RepID=A0A819S237_9BILA|nr:unnamed protein product [Adineta steineri]CAF1203714.1 unnamed protein product [Adineta steineri]CAF1269749.1 unnamed protein product [Adineta steineri]CAF3594507.1 unnamed protein product [Adineta steineri]CAF3716677.1 unnamed protein product [Adineta steineri]